MPDRDYTLNYVVNAGAATTALNNLAAALVAAAGQAGTLTATQNALNASLQATALSATAAGTAVGTVKTGTADLATEIGNLIPKMMVFEAAKQLVGGFGEAINSARDALKKLGVQAQETRDRMRELANLKGHTGPDDRIVAKTVVMGMEGALKPKEAVEFMEQFEGSIPAGREKGNVKPEMEERLAIAGMKFGVRHGLQPKTAGDITGVLAQYGKLTSVEQARGKLGAIAYALNEGRGNLEPLMASLIKASGAVVEEHGGPITTPEEAAAALGVAALNSKPDRAGTQLIAAVRGVRHVGDQEARFLETVGINPTVPFTKALAQLTPGIVAADKEGIGGDTYLKKMGFRQTDEIRALVQLARNHEAYVARVAKATQPHRGKADMEADEDFLMRDKAGIHRRVEARLAGSEELAGHNEEQRLDARAAGAVAMRERGELGGTMNVLRRGVHDLAGLMPWMGNKTAMQFEQEVAFMKTFQKEAARVGVDLYAEYNARGGDTGTDKGRTIPHLEQIFEHEHGGFMRDMIQKVTLAGGDPFRGGGGTRAGLNRMAADDQAREDAEIVQMMVRQSDALNVPARGFGGDKRPNVKTMGHDTAATWMENQAEAIKAAGGDPFGGSATLHAKFDKLIEEVTRSRQAAEKKAAAAAGRGNAPAAPARF